jgi:hypothetical protein
LMVSVGRGWRWAQCGCNVEPLTWRHSEAFPSQSLIEFPLAR